MHGISTCENVSVQEVECNLIVSHNLHVVESEEP